jgi:hypothetical protein
MTGAHVQDRQLRTGDDRRTWIMPVDRLIAKPGTPGFGGQEAPHLTFMGVLSKIEPPSGQSRVDKPSA